MGRPHVVAFAWPGQGHVNPVMRFSLKLAAQGFLVTFVHTEYYLRHIMEKEKEKGGHNSESYFKEHNLEVRLVGVPDGLPVDHPRDVVSLIKAVADPQGVPKYFRELMHRLDTPPTCIVSDFFIMFTQDVANDLGIPRIAIYIQSASSFNCHAAVARGFRPPPDATEEYRISSIPGLKPFKKTNMISFLQCYDPSDFLFQFMTLPFKRLGEPAWIVVNTFEELEAEAIAAMTMERDKIIPLGPFLPPSVGSNEPLFKEGTSFWPEENGCLKWLDNQAAKSVLYISFGSMATLSTRQLEELANGVRDSGKSFLWVVRPGSIEEGSCGFFEGFKICLQGRGMFVSWAPQVHVLNHPSVGAFITHCGWNSILECIAAGVPMLTWAYFADQMLNRQCLVEDWGIGLTLDAASSSDDDGGVGVVSSHEVQSKVKLIIGNDVGDPSSTSNSIVLMKEKLKKLSEAANRSISSSFIDHDTASHQGFKSLIEELGHE